MIYVIAKITIKEGCLPELIKAVTPALEATRKEKGCIYYNLSQDVQQPLTLTFTECWETREALTAHFTAPHFITWRAAGAPFITSRAIEIIHAVNVEKL
jgi:quinol monooxygenase YgiN